MKLELPEDYSYVIIQLILTCKRIFFDTEKVHFDVSGDNILLYENDVDLSQKLLKRLEAILNEET